MVQMVLGSVIKGTRPWKAFLCLSALNIQRRAVFFLSFQLASVGSPDKLLQS